MWGNPGKLKAAAEQVVLKRWTQLFLIVDNHNNKQPFRFSDIKQD